MRKAIVFLLCVACLGTASAQITIHDTPKSVDLLAIGKSTLTKFEREKGRFYYLLFLSSNKYDSYCIALGFKNEALNSLNQLEGSYKEDDYFTITDDVKCRFICLTNKDNCYMIKEENSTGDYAKLRLADIREFIKALSYE